MYTNNTRIFTPTTTIPETMQVYSNGKIWPSAPLPTIMSTTTTNGLNADQRRVFDAFLAGHNIFLTGQAGVGKSYIINAIVEHRQAIGQDAAAVTATTGAAAVLIHGSTIHSWAFADKGDGDTQALIQHVKKRPDIRTRWRQCRLLVIDEVSMLGPGLLVNLDAVGRAMRPNQSDKPLGGVQLVLSGDFCQLPPVVARIPGHRGPKRHISYAFEHAIWKTLGMRTYNLSVNMRQTDAPFQRLLAESRFGRLSIASTLALQARNGVQPRGSEGVGGRPLEIVCKVLDAKVVNDRELGKLRDTGVPFNDFEAEVTFCQRQTHAGAPTIEVPRPTTKQLEKWLMYVDKHCMTPLCMKLAVGCKVMLLHNLDIPRGLCNGAVGLVVGFAPNVVDESKKKKATATSRCRVFPIVDFACGVRGMVIKPVERTVVVDQKVEAHVDQIPLMLCWAITVHKAQGSTVDCAILDMNQTFDPGQAYTMLSRVRSLDGIGLRNFDATKVQAEPRVIAFYETEARVSLADLYGEDSAATRNGKRQSTMDQFVVAAKPAAAAIQLPRPPKIPKPSPPEFIVPK